MRTTSAGRLAHGALAAALQQARDAEDTRPAFELPAGSLAELGIPIGGRSPQLTATGTLGCAASAELAAARAR